MAEKDKIVRMTLMDGEVSVLASRTTQLVDEAKKIHDLTNVCTAALGRTLTAAAMMCCGMKRDADSMTAVIRGDGPIGGIVVSGDGALRLRGYVYHPRADVPNKAEGKLDVGGVVGNGTLMVLKDLGLKEPYSGQVDLVSGEIAEDFAQYFALSEQQRNAVSLGVLVKEDVLGAGGVIVAPMPGCGEALLQEVQDRIGEFYGISSMLSRGEQPEEIVERVFRPLRPKLLDQRFPVYSCNCSQERLEQVILSMGAQEIRDMIDQDGGAEVHCHFCNQIFQFSGGQLEALLERATSGEPM
ncbi:MAG: Hsp33 family molecular chaperone HslO [Christensenellales bacterium]|jgi:molecular chaperone Hsp33